MQVKHYSNLMKITPHAQAKNISIKIKILKHYEVFDMKYLCK